MGAASLLFAQTPAFSIVIVPVAKPTETFTYSACSKDPKWFATSVSREVLSKPTDMPKVGKFDIDGKKGCEVFFKDGNVNLACSEGKPNPKTFQCGYCGPIMTSLNPDYKEALQCPKAKICPNEKVLNWGTSTSGTGSNMYGNLAWCMW